MERCVTAARGAPIEALSKVSTNKHFERCAVAMQSMLHGDVRPVPVLVTSMYHFLSDDAPAAGDHVAFVKHVAVRTQAVLTALFHLACITDAPTPLKGEGDAAGAGDDAAGAGDDAGDDAAGDDEPPDTFFKVRAPATDTFARVSSFTMGAMAMYGRTRAVTLGVIASEVWAISADLMVALVGVALLAGYAQLAAFFGGLCLGSEKRAMRRLPLMCAVAALAQAAANHYRFVA